MRPFPLKKKRTAIVGPSESGKNTIVGLLEKWYELNGNMADNAIIRVSLYERNVTDQVIDPFLQVWYHHNGKSKIA